LNFTDLNLIEPIAKAIQEQGYTTPTPIQERSIPDILEGRFLGCAQTGTENRSVLYSNSTELIEE
jgi:ATP-dependent RNA helicase RhlE